MATPASLPELQIAYEDDPRVVREAATEDYATHIVPRTWRSSVGSLSMAWYSLFSAMFWLIVASLVALTVGTVNALIGIALSVIVYGAINYVISSYAARTGTSVNLFSRSLFGYFGAALAPLLFAATAVFYATFEGSVIAVALEEYFGAFPIEVWYLIVVLYSVPLVIGGVRVWLDKFNGVLLPFYIIGLITAVVWTIAVHGYDSEWLTQKPDEIAVSGPGWWWAFVIYMGVWIMMMYTWDYARYGRIGDEKMNGIVTFGPVFYLATLLGNALVGIFLTFSVPTEGDLSEISFVVGLVGLMGLAAVALVWVSQTRINTANFYLASTNLENFAARVFKLRLPRVAWAVIVGVIVYLIMLVDIFTILLEALQYQGILIVAWVAIALTHIGWSRLRGVRPDQAEVRPGRVPLFNVGGVAAWAIGTAVGVVLLEAGGSFGATWFAPFTFLAAFLVYAASLEFARPSWFVLERPHDPRAEVDDPWEARVRCHVCGKSYIAQEMDRDPSADHAPICAGDAQARARFYRAAKEESERTRRAAATAAAP